QLEIANEQVAFEHKAFFIALAVGVRLNCRTRQSAQQERTPPRDRIVEQNSIGYAGRHIGPGAGSRAPGESPGQLRPGAADLFQNLVKQLRRRGFGWRGKGERRELLLPKLGLCPQGGVPSEPHLDLLALGSPANPQRIGGSNLVRIFAHYFPMHIPSSRTARWTQDFTLPSGAPISAASSW